MHKGIEVLQQKNLVIMIHWYFIIFCRGARRRIPTAETTAIRREGNIHRLTNHRDLDDDENNTWNGNSTQQM
jgi:hypothetical protein